MPYSDQREHVKTNKQQVPWIQSLEILISKARHLHLEQAPQMIMTLTLVG